MKKIVLILIATFTIASGVVAGSEPKTGINVGDKAPNIVEQSVDSKEMKLSDLKGKLVLIDFWASWCPPCRRENPVVVQAYEDYKDKDFKNGNGFTVFSVSLDKNKASWQKAIADDKLSWEYHVSDLKGWNAKYASIYQVRGIPTNFLIDGDGIIIATNLRGHALQSKLKELLK